MTTGTRVVGVVEQIAAFGVFFRLEGGSKALANGCNALPSGGDFREHYRVGDHHALVVISRPKDRQIIVRVEQV